MTKLIFKVAMNDEEKKLGNTTTVVINVNRPDGIPDIIWDYACANYKVKLQAQIRPNWGLFIEDTFPKTLEFGQSLYATARGRTIVKEVTVEATAELLNKKSELDKLTYIIDTLERAGMTVPDSMWDDMEALTPDSEVTKIDEEDEDPYETSPAHKPQE